MSNLVTIEVFEDGEHYLPVRGEYGFSPFFTYSETEAIAKAKEEYGEDVQIEWDYLPEAIE